MWTQLVQCPGWELLKQKTQAYWTDNLSNHLAVASDDRDDVVALNRIRQVIAGKNAALAVLALPTEELRRLESQTNKGITELAESFSRRGGL